MSFSRWLHSCRRTKCAVNTVALVLLTLLTTSCAKLNSIHRTHTLDAESVDVVTVDAKQRHLLARQTEGDFRVCAEAAPDAFSAYAASLGADLALDGKSNNAKAALAAAETAATIERTQTVNVLRELMYRTCERYLSGALTREQLIVQAARDQTIILSVLAIEQLTGAVRAKPTIISGPATSAAVIDGQQAAELIKRFSDEEKAAIAASAKAKADLAAADTKGKCVANATKPADVSAEDWSTCVAAKALAATRETEATAATTRLNNALKLASDLVDKSNASTQAGTNSGDAGGSQPDAAAIAAVAGAVERIIYKGFDEVLMFCIAQLSSGKALPQQIVDTCSDVMRERESRNDRAFERLFAASSATGERFQDDFTTRFKTAVGAAIKNGKLLTATKAFDAKTTNIRGVLSMEKSCTDQARCEAAVASWLTIYGLHSATVEEALREFQTVSK